jgi:hypothetical protein
MIDVLVRRADDLREAGILKIDAGHVSAVVGPKPPKVPERDEDEKGNLDLPPTSWDQDGASFPSGRVPTRRRPRSSDV